MDKNKELNFAYMMRSARKKKGISLQGLSDTIENEYKKNRISQSYLSRLENNEYENPSISNILIISQILGLDLNEVVKSFGFKSLVDEDSNDIDIEQMIMKFNIKAPLEQDGGAVIDYEFLDDKEKELLVSIINSVFAMGVCLDNSVIFNIGNILKDLEEYRFIRKGKAEKKQTFNHYTDIKYNVFFSEGFETILDKFSITDEEVMQTIDERKDEIPKSDKAFILINEKKLIGIWCYKKGSAIEVYNLTEFHSIV